MSHHPTSFTGDVPTAVKSAIAERLPDARIEVTGGGGHYSIVVVSPTFEGKTTLQRQRLVLGAIAHLMKGDGAPVHAVDSMQTTTS